MWTYLYGLWRSVLRTAVLDEPEAAAGDFSSRDALQEDLRRLMVERTNLQKTAASYEDFGYDDQAVALREQLRVMERRIQELRRKLHGPQVLWRDGSEGSESR